MRILYMSATNTHKTQILLWMLCRALLLSLQTIRTLFTFSASEWSGIRDEMNIKCRYIYASGPARSFKSRYVRRTTYVASSTWHIHISNIVYVCRIYNSNSNVLLCVVLYFYFYFYLLVFVAHCSAAQGLIINHIRKCCVAIISLKWACSRQLFEIFFFLHSLRWWLGLLF